MSASSIVLAVAAASLVTHGAVALGFYLLGRSHARRPSGRLPAPLGEVKRTIIKAEKGRGAMTAVEAEKLAAEVMAGVKKYLGSG